MRHAVFFAPFGPWTAHVVELGPIWIGQRDDQCPPMLLKHRHGMSRLMVQKQNRGDVGCERRVHPLCRFPNGGASLLSPAISRRIFDDLGRGELLHAGRAGYRCGCAA